MLQTCTCRIWVSNAVSLGRGKCVLSPCGGVVRIKLVIGENIEPSPWDGLGSFRWRCEYVGSFTMDELVTDLKRSIRQCRVLEIVGLETILLRDTTWPSRGEIITEEQLLMAKELLEDGLAKTHGEVTEQLIFKTRQQHHREDTYGECSREEKEKWLEEANSAQSPWTTPQALLTPAPIFSRSHF
jgi:hypothetical protein